jgi:hypothetical protein
VWNSPDLTSQATVLRASPEIGNVAAENNPSSLEVIAGACVEPALAATNSRVSVQLERQGYFCPDPVCGKKLEGLGAYCYFQRVGHQQNGPGRIAVPSKAYALVHYRGDAI